MSDLDLVFSKCSLFHLQKLASHVRTSTGSRHKLSDQNSMMQLLKKAVLSDNDNVQLDLNNFVSHLDDSQLQTLRKQGILLKRKAS